MASDTPTHACENFHWVGAHQNQGDTEHWYRQDAAFGDLADPLGCLEWRVGRAARIGGL
jgi:hypothetical protein